MRRLNLPAVYALLAPFLLVTGLFFIVPLGLVGVYSFLKPGIAGGVEWHLSWEAYTRILFERDFDGAVVFNPAYIDIFLRSVKIGALCTLLCVLAGFPTAYFIAMRPRASRHFWVLLVSIPFWTNLLIRTYAWMLILRSNGPVNEGLMSIGLLKEPLPLLYNDFAVAVGLLYSYLPFMILPIYASLEKMDWNLVEAAQDLYASRWRALVRVTLPLSLPGILAGSVLVFIPAIGSFLAPDLLGSGKEVMIGNLIQMQFGFSRNWPFGAALSIVLMAVVMAGLIVLTRRGVRIQTAAMQG